MNTPDWRAENGMPWKNWRKDDENARKPKKSWTIDKANDWEAKFISDMLLLKSKERS